MAKTKTKKPRNKKHNLARQMNIRHHNLTDQRLTAWSIGQRGVKLFLHNGQRARHDPKLAQLYQTQPFRWCSYCVLTYRSIAGQEYTDVTPVAVNEPVTYTSLIDLLNGVHEQMIREAEHDGQFMVSAGWVASTTGRDISDEVIHTIMKDLGGWDTASQWELDNLDDPETRILNPEIQYEFERQRQRLEQESASQREPGSPAETAETGRQQDQGKRHQ